jgi:transglutaminase-like putative cysteine protease
VRSILLEQPAKKNEATEFQIVYDYTAEGVSFKVDSKMVKAVESNDSQLKPFLAEEAHVVFTPEIRHLAERVAAGETNPYLKARKFYDWIAGNIKYSYAIEYSTIRNISEYTRTKCYGDCGQEALLFITLCRVSGIPARFQSGWNTFPGAKTIHDWAEIYVAPYGWMPVDPYMGIYATQYVRTLDAEQKRTLRDFYFGGLDQFRMIANRGHEQVLNPPKRSMRSDDVDFQRGELEYGDHNIYFNKYKYRLDVRELEPKKLD